MNTKQKWISAITMLALLSAVSGAQAHPGHPGAEGFHLLFHGFDFLIAAAVAAGLALACRRHIRNRR